MKSTSSQEQRSTSSRPMQRNHRILLASEHSSMQADAPFISLPCRALFSRTPQPEDHTREDFVANCLSEALRLSTDWHLNNNSSSLRSDVRRRPSQ
jgi:hypothetical protein